MSSNADQNLDDLYKWMTEVRDRRDAQAVAESGLGGVLFLLARGQARRHRQTFTVTQVERMLQTEDKRAIAPLLVALSFPLGRLRPSVKSALARLLLSLEKGDSLDALGPSRWRLLHLLENLDPNHDPQLLLALLHALETSGTADDLCALRRWAWQRYRTNAEQAITLATHRCLQTIERREDRAQDRWRLLRSVADRKDPLELLRATPVAPHHEPDKLLRTADRGPGDAERLEVPAQRRPRRK